MKTDSTTGRRHTRRDVLRVLAVGGIAGAAWKLGLFDRWRHRAVTRSRVLMGTSVKLTVLNHDRDAAEVAADAMLERMVELEALLSRYRADSEVSRLNATGRLDHPSDALLHVMRAAERVSALGDGAFDVTVQPLLDLRAGRTGLPDAAAIEQAVARVDHRAVRIDADAVMFQRPEMRITLDGIGKGYIVDRGVGVLQAHGFPNVFVDAGGDLVAGGSRGDNPWRVAIRAPRPGLALQARLETRDRAVATSGDYMQPFTPDFAQHHILDPRTGYSAPELASSTVVGPDAMTADALATLTMVLGPRQGRELLEDLPDCEGYMVSKDLTVTQTSGFRVV